MLIMVVTATGFYEMVATLTNAFDSVVPGGTDPFTGVDYRESEG